MMDYRTVKRELLTIQWLSESLAQFENQIKARVYIRPVTPSSMYEKAPFH